MIELITCVGNETNLRASYWHQLLIMLEKEEKEYLGGGGVKEQHNNLKVIHNKFTFSSVEL